MELFTDIDDFKLYVQGVDSSLDLNELEPAYNAARGTILKSITLAVFDAVKAVSGVKESLKAALANYAMYHYLIHWSVSRNGTDQKVYKYQYEEIKEEYISQFWLAMDAVLTYLDENPSTGGWDATPGFTHRQELPVKSAVDFDYYYAIDGSQYFFSKVMFLIRKVTKNSILPRIGAFSTYDAEDDKDFLDQVYRCLCYEVMAEAVMKFDLTELPRSIRYDLTHEFTKAGSQMQARKDLYNDLMADVDAWHSAIENAVRLRAGSSDVTGNKNDESDKYYMTL